MYEHQIEAYDFLTATRRAIYGDGAGTGKTAVALRTAVVGWEAKRILVLASSEEILDHWMAQAAEWVGEVAIPIMGAGTAARRSVARSAASEEHDKAQILVLNYEAVWRDVDKLIDVGFDAIICDEAHNLKNRQSATFKAVDKLARRAEFFVGVTGTPILNRADEAWSLLHLIDPKAYPSYWKWVNYHFDVEITDFHGTVKRPIQLVKGLKPGHESLVRDEIAPYLIQRSYDEVFPGLPPALTYEVRVELGPEERAHYDALVRRSWTRVGDEKIITTNEVAKTTRLRQLTSSWATWDAEMDDPGAKIHEALQLDAYLANQGEQVLILSAYQETARRIAQEIGEDALAYTGETPKAERRAILQAFKDGDLRVLSATIGTLGEGVDGLQVAHHLIQLDRDWTPARNEQVLARLRRGGQTKQVTAWYIVAHDTVDDAVSQALARKTDIINSLL